jgi:hypothetical protein
MTYPLRDSEATFSSASADLQFAAVMASFGMLLRNSKHKGDASYAAVMEMASGARGDDRSGRRGEFLQLVKAAGDLAGERISFAPVRFRVPGSFVAPPHRQSRAASSWLGFMVGVVAGTAIVLIVALIVFVTTRMTVRPVSFACRAPTKAACG